MSIETEIKKLTAAIETLAATLSNRADAPVAAKPATAKVAPAKAAKAAVPAEVENTVEAPEVTKKMLVDATLEVARKVSSEVARGVLAKYGATKVPELTDESAWPAVYADMQSKLAS